MTHARVNHDVLAIIAQYCDFDVLSTLAPASALTAQIAHRERRRRVITGLVPFSGAVWPTPMDILHLLEMYNAVIAGSFALNIVTSGVPVKDLNIIVANGKTAAVRAEVESWGYRLDDCPERRALHAAVPAFAKRVVDIISLTRQTDGRRIEVVESRTPYPLDAVLSFPNTLAQNFVTSSSVCCLYPRLTLERRALASSPTAPDRALASILLKYKDRGFKIHSDNRFMSAQCGVHCPLEYRDLYSNTVAYMRFSDYDETETGRKLPPRTRRRVRGLIQLGRDFRMGSFCANMLCPRCNISWDM